MVWGFLDKLTSTMLCLPFVAQPLAFLWAGVMGFSRHSSLWSAFLWQIQFPVYRVLM